VNFVFFHICFHHDIGSYSVYEQTVVNLNLLEKHTDCFVGINLRAILQINKVTPIQIIKPFKTHFKIIL